MHAYLNAWKNAFNFSGRASRSEYWSFTLGNCAIALTLMTGAVLTSTAQNLSPLFLVSQLFVLATIVPGLAVAVRRLHDTGRSGSMFLISFVPVVGVTLLLWFCQDSEAGHNQFGPSPKGDEGFGEPHPGFAAQAEAFGHPAPTQSGPLARSA